MHLLLRVQGVSQIASAGGGRLLRVLFLWERQMSASAAPEGVLCVKGGQITSNNAFEWTESQRGPRLARQSGWRAAVQLGR